MKPLLRNYLWIIPYPTEKSIARLFSFRAIAFSLQEVRRTFLDEEGNALMSGFFQFQRLQDERRCVAPGIQSKCACPMFSLLLCASHGYRGWERKQGESLLFELCHSDGLPIHTTVKEESSLPPDHTSSRTKMARASARMTKMAAIMEKTAT